MELDVNAEGRLDYLFQRFRWLILAGLLGIGLIVAWLESWRPEAVRPVKSVVYSLLDVYIHPIQEVSARGRELVSHTGEMWNAEKELETLQERLMKTETQLQIAREDLRRFGRISGLRDWRTPDGLEFLLADVIGLSTADQTAQWTINLGSADNIEPGLPAVGENGLAGVVREVYARSARVQALTDPLSAVGVTDAESRAKGMVFGRGRTLPLEYVPESESEPIRQGAQLITSGFAGSVYPKGIVVGAIRAIRYSDRGVAYGVVQAAENLNAIEELLIIRYAGPAGAGKRVGLGTFSLDMTTTPTLALEAAPTSPTLTLDEIGANEAPTP